MPGPAHGQHISLSIAMALSSTWLSQCQYGQLHASVPSHRWYRKLSHNGHGLPHTAAAEYGTLSHVCGHFLQLYRLLRSLQVYWLLGILQHCFAMVPVGACAVAYDLPMPSNTGALAAGIVYTQQCYFTQGSAKSPCASLNL